MDNIAFRFKISRLVNISRTLGRTIKANLFEWKTYAKEIVHKLLTEGLESWSPDKFMRLVVCFVSLLNRKSDDFHDSQWMRIWDIYKEKTVRKLNVQSATLQLTDNRDWRFRRRLFHGLNVRFNEWITYN